jgi:hypothetical protein
MNNQHDRYAAFARLERQPAGFRRLEDDISDAKKCIKCGDFAPNCPCVAMPISDALETLSRLKWKACRGARENGFWIFIGYVFTT